MKTEIKVRPHLMRGQMGVPEDARVIELHYNGQLIGTVVGADGPGVRVISKHSISMPTRQPTPPPEFPPGTSITELSIDISCDSKN